MYAKILDIGDKVLCLKCGIKRKYCKHKSDPYRITAVHTNGTVAIAQGVKRQQISIRNIKPYISIENLDNECRQLNSLIALPHLQLY